MQDLLEWLLQEVLNLEFSQSLGLGPMNAARIGKDIAIWT